MLDLSIRPETCDTSFFFYETVSENIFFRLVSSASKIKGMGGGGGGGAKVKKLCYFLSCQVIHLSF